MQLSVIHNKIYELRNQKIMLVPIAMGIDLAEIYAVETKVLNQVVKRNFARFPRFPVSSYQRSMRVSKVTNCDLRNRRPG